MNVQAIKEVMNQSLDKKVVFEDFANQAKSLGVAQIALNLKKREHTFYGASSDFFVEPLPSSYQFAIAQRFDEDTLKQAIFSFDSQKITPHEFMATMAKAGVMTVTAFLEQQCCLYMGNDGGFYLERW